MSMKLILAVFLSISSVFASVSIPHAKNVFKGEYRFIDEDTGDQVTFTIGKKSDVKLDENNAYYESKTTLDSLTNGLGPGGLPVLSVMLAGGSDEQEVTLVIRLVPIQDGRTNVNILDAILLDNDGPNELSFARKSKLTLEKMNKDGKFEAVSAI